MASILTNALQAAAATGDANATAYLVEQERSNFGTHIHQLCVELGSKDRSLPARTLAGLTIKNAIDGGGRSDAAIDAATARWRTLSEQARAAIKGMILQILHDEESKVRHTAALVVGKIASIEIPTKEWPDLIQILDANITKQPAATLNVGLKQSSLEALGYVCEEVPNELQAYSNSILTAIATGMDAGEVNSDIKLAATVCLVNSIEFIKTNMEVEADRNTIMAMVFSVTTSPQEKVRVAAFQCIVQIANSYYKYLPAYIGVIFTLTTKAIASDTEDVAQQAIEFWSTVADVELECEEEDEENEGDKSHVSRSRGYIKDVVAALTPFLLQALTKQNENPEDDEWGVSLAAGTCLGLLSQVSKDAIVDHVLPFVQSNVSNQNWRNREAAILAFGCILDGPNKGELAKVVQSAFTLILSHMKDSHALVKDTTAWTVGRICSLLPEVIDATTLPLLMNTLIAGLTESPKVASNVCWAIRNLASSVETEDEEASALSPHFQPVVHALLMATQRTDIKECNLQVSVYEALNMMITSASLDVHSLVANVLPMIMVRLGETLKERAESAEEREAQNEIQALLCGSLQAIVTKLDVSAILPNSDNLMMLFLQVLQSKSSTVHEEALMAIGAIADKIETNFIKYLGFIKIPLLTGLQNAQEYHVCDVAVHATCDVTRAVGAAFAPWGDEVMKILLGHLQNPSIERMVKSHIIACIGDIALAVSGHFERYMMYVIPMLLQASVTIFAADDYDNIEYLQNLRESIIDAYSGILLGLSAENKTGVFTSQAGLLDSIITLFDVIADDVNVSQRVLRGASGLIYDLVSKLGPQVAQKLKRKAVQSIIQLAQDDRNENETIKNGAAAQKVMMSA